MKATAATTILLLSLALGYCTKAAPALSSRQASTNIPSYSNVDVQTTLLDTTWPWRVYKSSPLQPPNMTITGNGGTLAPGLVFLTPSGIFNENATKQGGGFLMTDDGDLVYGIIDDGITDLRMQVYQGTPYLTYWDGYNTEGLNIGHGYGYVNIIDQDYNIDTVVDPAILLDTMGQANGTVDIHEHQITDNGTILITAYNNTPADLSSILGPKDGWIVDSIAAEIDIATQEVLFLWRASDHLPFNASHSTTTSPPTPGIGTESRPYDWFHINSIQRVGDNYLINSRRCWASYMVAPNGTILWSLEGTDGGSFGALPSDGTFSWEHFVRAHNVTETSMDVSIFDNHNAVENVVETVPTRLLVYHLELPPSKNYTPILTHRVETESDPLYVGSQGSYIPSLANGNQFAGYGQISICREYGPATDGSDLRWQAQFGAENAVQSYRCFKEEWHGTPASWDPSLVVYSGDAYVSWNGATDVQCWNVYTGILNSSLTPVGVAEKAGFETVFAVPSGAMYVQVGAVQNGTEVRRSNVASV